jgi:hypothetical protein
MPHPRLSSMVWSIGINAAAVDSLEKVVTTTLEMALAFSLGSYEIIPENKTIRTEKRT